MKKLIAFDLDDTLAVTKSPISDEIANLLTRLAGLYEVCVITGGTYDQVERAVLSRLNVSVGRLANLHFLPVNGGRYHYFDVTDNAWRQERWAEDLSAADKRKISRVLEKVARRLGYWESDPTGEIIADRGSQITYSALGQLARPEDKYVWDPNYKKRQELYEAVSKELSDFEVRINGNTSLDVTKTGIDKGFGMERLRERLHFERDEVLFIGDQLQEGGNDYPVKALGIDTINVYNVKQTVYVIEGLIKSSYKDKMSQGGGEPADRQPPALDRLVGGFISLQVSSKQDMKRKLRNLLQDHELEVLDTHNTASILFKFTVGSSRYGLKIEYGAAKALRDEARWYELAPTDLKPHHVMSHVSDKYTFVLLRWLPRARTLEEVAIANEGVDTQKTIELIIKALDQDRELFYSNPIVPLFAAAEGSFFLDKYHAYNADAKRFPYLQRLLQRKTVRVNGKELPGPYRFVQAVQQDDKLCAYLSPDRAGLIHGDSHADNLLVQDDAVYLIDPKGADHLPLEYDTGRIFWSLNGWNAICRGEYELTTDGSAFEFSVTRRQQY